MTNYDLLEWLASQTGQTGADIYAESGASAFTDLAKEYGTASNFKILTNEAGESFAMINNTTGEISTVVDGVAQEVNNVGFNAVTAVDSVAGETTTAVTCTSGATTAATTTAGEAGVTMGGVTLGSAVMAGTAALGGVALGVKMYNDNPEFWTHTSKALLPFCYGQSYTDSGAEIKDAMHSLMPVAVNGDGKTYLPKEFMEKLKDELLANNIFNITLSYPETFNNTINSLLPATDLVNKAISDATSSNNEYHTGIITVLTSTIVQNAITQHNNKLCYIDAGYSNGWNNFNMCIYDYGVGDTIPVSSGIFQLDHSKQLFALHTDLVSDRVMQDEYTTNTFNDAIETTTYKYHYGNYDNINKMSIRGSNMNALSSGSITGLSGQTSAIYPVAGTPLATTFPAWYSNKLQLVDPNSGPSAVDFRDWYPVTMNNQYPDTIPDTTTATQTAAQTGENPSTINGNMTNGQSQVTSNMPQVHDILNKGGITTTPIPPITTGETPPPAPPLINGSANGLWAIYNPTEAQIQSFGAWLWDSSIIDQIIKMVSNPMEAIITLHTIYCTPITSGTGTIKCGYLDSSVSSALVSNQYSEIDCGTITVPEIYQSSLDYNNTGISIYLPFVGIVPLNTHDVMGAQLHLTYRIDVLTGTCLAQIEVIKQNSNAVLYTFNGNCAVEIPLTSGNYGSIIAGLVSAVGGATISAVSGGSLAPAAIGIGSAVINSRTNVQQSGNLGSNAGALGIRKPYLIITRPLTYNCSNYNQYYGYPANKLIQLANVKGFVRCRDFTLNGISATENEKTEISNLLRTGIFIE